MSSMKDLKTPLLGLPAICALKLLTKVESIESLHTGILESTPTSFMD